MSPLLTVGALVCGLLFAPKPRVGQKRLIKAGKKVAVQQIQDISHDIKAEGLAEAAKKHGKKHLRRAIDKYRHPLRSMRDARLALKKSRQQKRRGTPPSSSSTKAVDAIFKAAKIGELAL